MKAYMYFSKQKIDRLFNPELIKKQIAENISDIFNPLDYITSSDVSIRCMKISNDIDVFIVLEYSQPREIALKMDEFKRRLFHLIQNDQGKALDYIIRSKVEQSHIPSGTEYKMERNESNPKQSSMVAKANSSEDNPDLDFENRSKAYVPVEPSYSFDRVIIPDNVRMKIEEAINILKYEHLVFEKWGLYEIQPNPSSSLSFFGPSGTGKTMAAEAIAKKLGKKILKVSYADVESKYHGEGPKMIKAIFMAAEREDAVLFFDEADSLLSKRLTNVTQGSEQAINSMRSQLLICLESFHGIVIFATNLVINYDNAFLTRLISVEFKSPDAPTRKRIWDVHIRPVNNGESSKLNIPLGDDVATQKLADNFDFSGREIRNAVISACISAAMQDKEYVCQEDFVFACEKIVKEKESLAKANDHTESRKEPNLIKQVIIDKIKKSDRNTSIFSDNE